MRLYYSSPRGVEHRQILSSMYSGKSLTVVRRRNISVALKIKFNGPLGKEYRRKLANAQRGKVMGPLTVKHKRKLRKAMRQYYASSQGIIMKQRLSKMLRKKQNSAGVPQ